MYRRFDPEKGETMRTARFGEFLGKLVPLSGQDVAEILEEQTTSHRRFGQIAMSWGLCQAEHVWQAWCDQLIHYPERIDLQVVGIDTQALGHLPAELARDFGVIPVRSLGDRVIFAASDESFEHAVEKLPKLLNKRIQFILADAAQIGQAIRNCYGLSPELCNN
jgi:hypothetical protein